MLRLLRVRNFALIDALELEFGPGLNVLSGETGAGKSLIVDALALITGHKASSEVIRTGETRATIEAVFDPPDTLDLAGIGIDPADELVLRREISTDNRNRVFINSQPSTVSGLRAIAPTLIEIHGQHDQQSLLDPRHQLSLVDRAAGSLELRSEAGRLFVSVAALERELAELEQSEAEILQRLDQLEFQRQEIERVNPVAGETAELRDQVNRLEHSEKLFQTAASGYQALYEDDEAVLDRLSSIEHALGEVAALDRQLGAIGEQAAAARSIIEDVAFALRDYTHALDLDPDRLDDLQSRLANLERLHRKYGDDLVAHLETVIQEMDTIGLRKVRRDEVSQRLSDLRTTFLDTCRRLSGARREAGTVLAERVTAEIRTLAMPEARFSIEWGTLDTPRSSGIDAPTFLLAPNPGEDAGSLAEIASGGELSRAMLALRTVMTGDGETGTLVFDEVDAGIGGEAAETVGRKLKGLASTYQVLSVTHLAQIARFADLHLRIEKLVIDDRTVTRIEPLDGNARIEELARMMSGPSVTDAARKHVRELLKRP